MKVKLTYADGEEEVKENPTFFQIIGFYVNNLFGKRRIKKVTFFIKNIFDGI